jgi:hypothetical protein
MLPMRSCDQLAGRTKSDTRVAESKRLILDKVERSNVRSAVISSDDLKLRERDKGESEDLYKGGLVHAPPL